MKREEGILPGYWTALGWPWDSVFNSKHRFFWRNMTPWGELSELPGQACLRHWWCVLSLKNLVWKKTNKPKKPPQKNPVPRKSAVMAPSSGVLHTCQSSEAQFSVLFLAEPQKIEASRQLSEPYFAWDFYHLFANLILRLVMGLGTLKTKLASAAQQHISFGSGKSWWHKSYIVSAEEFKCQCQPMVSNLLCT